MCTLQNTVGYEEGSICAKIQLDPYSHVGTIHTCDGQTTDVRTNNDTIHCARTASRGKG